MKLRIFKEIFTQGTSHVRYAVKDETGVTRASTRTRDEARKFVQNHKDLLKVISEQDKPWWNEVPS